MQLPVAKAVKAATRGNNTNQMKICRFLATTLNTLTGTYNILFCFRRLKGVELTVRTGSLLAAQKAKSSVYHCHKAKKKNKTS